MLVTYSFWHRKQYFETLERMILGSKVVLQLFQASYVSNPINHTVFLTAFSKLQPSGTIYDMIGPLDYVKKYIASEKKKLFISRPCVYSSYKSRNRRG